MGHVMTSSHVLPLVAGATLLAACVSQTTPPPGPYNLLGVALASIGTRQPGRAGAAAVLHEDRRHGQPVLGLPHQRAAPQHAPRSRSAGRLRVLRAGAHHLLDQPPRGPPPRPRGGATTRSCATSARTTTPPSPRPCRRTGATRATSPTSTWWRASTPRRVRACRGPLRSRSSLCVVSPRVPRSPHDAVSHMHAVRIASCRPLP